MTSIPEVPGAQAVVLYKEQVGDDALHMQSWYYRIKVLGEGGKEQANVQLPFASGASGQTVDSISGRTIHADGTIIPFTGKPYEKLIEENQGYKVKMKVFTLPSVEVGSIIEYRYKIHLDDNYFSSPDWYIQNDLYVRKAHYMWRPTDRVIESEDGKHISSTVAWTPILPAGVVIKQSAVQISRGADGGSTELNLDVHDIMPLPREQYMPPMQSLSYRVLFYYTSFRASKEYWISKGKQWSKARDKFIGPGTVVRAAVEGITLPQDSQEQKLRKLYAAVMALENTDFTRERSTSEERANGLKNATTADDILTRKRGSGDQMAALFVSMARAAGMKAYLMTVAKRDTHIFLSNYLNINQLDDDIAIVNVDGKDMFFDPGQRYCSFGQLAWKHTLAGGLRQAEGNPAVASTPGSSFKDEHISRVADLALDDRGEATGTVVVTLTGDPALRWRQEALRGDDTSLNADLRSDMEHLLPGGMEVRVTRVDNLTLPELPLKIIYDLKGTVASSTGKRLLVPADLFQVNSHSLFPEAKRELAIDMHFPSWNQDAVRWTLPASLILEMSPTAEQAQVPNKIAFDMSTRPGPNSITIFRNVTVGRTFYSVPDYPELKSFYSKLEAKDQETLVLTRAPAGVKADSGAN